MHRLRTRKANRAFTLVELLVVVLILAILMAVALPLYLGAIRNSEVGASRANMQTIANANQSYRLKNGAYTTNIAQLEPDLGTQNVIGPGNPQREYEIITSGTCDPDGPGPKGAADGPVTAFAVQLKSSLQSTYTEDGCFIPGLSAR